MDFRYGFQPHGLPDAGDRVIVDRPLGCARLLASRLGPRVRVFDSYRQLIFARLQRVADINIDG